MKIYAWIGEDELGSGVVGIKQANVPAGFIPLVSIHREKLDRDYIKEQLQVQATVYGKTIRLAEFTLTADSLVELKPKPDGP